MSVAANTRDGCRAGLGETGAGLADFALAKSYAKERRALVRYSVNYSDLLFKLGRYRQAVEVAEEGLADARRFGVERTSGVMMRINMVEPLLELGDIDAAERVSEAVLPVNPLDVHGLYLAKSRVGVLAWRGRHEEAARLLRARQRALRSAAAVEQQVWYGMAEMQATIAMSAGDPDAALAAYLPAVLADGPALERARLLLGAAHAVAEARAAGRDCTAEAKAVDEAWQSLPESLRDPVWGAVVQGFLEPSPESLRDALDHAGDDRVPAALRPALRLELARSLLAARQRGDAAAALAEAAEAADRLAHEPMRRAIAAFAATSGLLHRGEHGDASDLTERERQVLELIAAGLSNRQIGERLYISPKTASVHVSAILRKLGVTSRTEAAVAAQDQLPRGTAH